MWFVSLFTSIFFFNLKVANVSIDVDRAQKLREKAIDSIKELVQTERNYIKNLKAIQKVLTYFEENKEENDLGKCQSKLVHIDFSSITYCDI